MTILENAKNIIVYREGWITPFVKGIPKPNVNYAEEEMGVYSLFIDEDVPSSCEPPFNDQLWYLHFDGASSCEGYGARILLYSPQIKFHQYASRLDFDYTNNFSKFEALLLGIEQALAFG